MMVLEPEKPYENLEVVYIGLLKASQSDLHWLEQP